MIVVAWALDCLAMPTRVINQALISYFCIGGMVEGGGGGLYARVV